MRAAGRWAAAAMLVLGIWLLPSPSTEGEDHGVMPVDAGLLGIHRSPERDYDGEVSSALFGRPEIAGSAGISAVAKRHRRVVGEARILH